ncbi:hypothetical protein QQP08_005174 [Theobroma cacao]|nr:hypothetical protein QQP08_005174 [Theobroma cacao]
MNKNEAYTQTKSDPKDLVQSYKERFMVLHLFKSLSSALNTGDSLLVLTMKRRTESVIAKMAPLFMLGIYLGWNNYAK